MAGFKRHRLHLVHDCNIRFNPNPFNWMVGTFLDFTKPPREGLILQMTTLFPTKFHLLYPLIS